MTEEKLHPLVLAELFGKSLVFTGEETQKKEKAKPVVPPKQELKKPYLGNYEKRIIVLVNDAQNAYTNDADLEFLTGILNACKLNLAHIALMNFNNSDVNFLQLKNEMQPAYLLMFGINALEIQLPFDMPDYQVQHYNNCSILISPALSALNGQAPEAKAEKTKLWKSLKNMFDLG